MNEHSFATLEYEGLRALVAERAQTPMGRERAAELAPLAARGRAPADPRRRVIELRRRGARSLRDVADPAHALRACQ